MILCVIQCDDCRNVLGDNDDHSEQQVLELAREAGWRVEGGHYCGNCEQKRFGTIEFEPDWSWEDEMEVCDE